MILMGIICALLGVGFIILALRLVVLKKDIRQLGVKLNELIKADTNAHLTTTTFDNDVVFLVEVINQTMEKNRQGHMEVKGLEDDLKHALTNISHDLRTPVTSAKGYVQMAENGNLDKETLQRYLSVIHGRLDNLTTLLDKLFTFSRAVEGNMVLEKVNISNVVRDTLVAGYAELENKGFSVEISIPDSPVYCICEENALKRVIQNLLSNAISHGNSYLRVRLTEEAIEFANKADNIFQIDVYSIFERFYTADAARTNKRTGLGLAIAKELTEKMNGRIKAERDGDLFVLRVCLPGG